MTKTKVWKVEEIKELLLNNNRMVGKSLIELRNCQTLEELEGKHTSELNGKGFNSFDAEILTNLADFYETKGLLTRRQLEVSRRKIMKYAKQLTIIANNKE